jgi:hypothetical protein
MIDHGSRSTRALVLPDLDLQSKGVFHLHGIVGAVDLDQGKHSLIAYVSPKLQKHEKNYTPFLLGQQITF